MMAGMDGGIHCYSLLLHCKGKPFFSTAPIFEWKIILFWEKRQGKPVDLPPECPLNGTWGIKHGGAAVWLNERGGGGPVRFPLGFPFGGIAVPLHRKQERQPFPLSCRLKHA